jgi:hypothetical protein
MVKHVPLFRQLQRATVIVLVAAFIGVFGYLLYLTNASATWVRPDPPSGRIYARSLVGRSVVYITRTQANFYAWYLCFGLGVSAALLDARWKVFRAPSKGMPKRFY